MHCNLLKKLLLNNQENPEQQRHGRGVAYFHILLKYYDKWYNKGLQNGEIPGELLNKVSYAKSGCKCNN